MCVTYRIGGRKAAWEALTLLSCSFKTITIDEKGAVVEELNVWGERGQRGEKKLLCTCGVTEEYL